jgi:hypothetical protein
MLYKNETKIKDIWLYYGFVKIITQYAIKLIKRSYCAYLYDMIIDNTVYTVYHKNINGECHYFIFYH